MRSVLVVTHGGICHEMSTFVKRLLGEDIDINSISVDESGTLDALIKNVDTWAKKRKEKQLLVLTDLVNSSATVASVSVAKKYGFEVVAGVNVPMILKAVTLEDDDIKTLIKVSRSSVVVPKIPGKKK